MKTTVKNFDSQNSSSRVNRRRSYRIDLSGTWNCKSHSMGKASVLNLAICWLLSVLLAFGAPVVLAVEVTVKGKGYNLRNKVGDRANKMGYIAPGTVLDIPNRFRVLDSYGAVDVERTLNKWLIQAGEADENASPENLKYRGRKKALFFPVKVLKWGKGSYLTKSFMKEKGLKSKEDFDGQVRIALSTMQRNGRLLVTHRGSDLDGEAEPQRKLYAGEPDKTKYGPVAHRGATRSLYTSDQDIARERQYKPVDPQYRNLKSNQSTEAGLCHECRKMSSSVQRLKDHLPITLGKLAARTEKSVQPFGQVEKKVPTRFKATCGINFAGFEKYMDKQLSSDPGLSKLLKMVMVKESAGRCQAENPEGWRPNSIGLFQINLGSTDYLKCSGEQSKKLKSMTLSQMASSGSVQCLENPVLNLKEAIRIYKEKERMLFGKRRGQPAHFDKTKMTDDERLRMILSAYNGGQKWVIRAKMALQEYNKKMGTDADHNKWEDLRLFYLRRALTNSEQIEMMGHTRVDRALKFAIPNLVYTETLVPRKHL